MRNVIVCKISDALNMNYDSERDLRDTKIYSKCKFQGIWTKINSGFCFPRQKFTKHSRLIYKIK